MFRKVSPANGYCLFFPNRRPGKRFVAGRSVRVGLFEEWKHIKLGLFPVLLPGETPLLITTSEGLECDLKASFGIVIGGPEEGREERLEKATISCPAKRSVHERERVELVPFFRDWAANYCRTAVIRSVRDCQYVRLIEEPEYRAKAEKEIERFAGETLAQIGMILVQCTVAIEPREPKGVFATADILTKWEAYKQTIYAAELSKLRADYAYEESKTLAEANHVREKTKLDEQQKREQAEMKQETQFRLEELVLAMKRKQSVIAIEEKQEESEKDRQLGLIQEEMATRTQDRQLARIRRQGELDQEEERKKKELADLTREQEREQITHRQRMLSEEKAVAEREVELLSLKEKLNAGEVAFEREKGAVKADNVEKEVLAAGAHEMRMRKLFFEALPGIIEHAGRPVEKIGEVRIMNLSGPQSADSGGQNSLGAVIASASTLPVIREIFRFLNELEGTASQPEKIGVVAEERVQATGARR